MTRRLLTLACLSLASCQGEAGLRARVEMLEAENERLSRQVEQLVAVQALQGEEISVHTSMLILVSRDRDRLRFTP